MKLTDDQKLSCYTLSNQLERIAQKKRTQAQKLLADAKILDTSVGILFSIWRDKILKDKGKEDV